MRRLIVLLVAVTLGSIVLASAAVLDVDGGVLQSFASPSPFLTPEECAGMDFDQVVYGTSGDDVLGEADPSAANLAQLVFGLAGDDTLYGGNQDDCLVGGDGDDTLYGGNGQDVLGGGAGGDVLVGGNGKDVLVGGDGDDVLTGGSGTDAFDGGDGADVCDTTPNETSVNCSP